MGHRGLGHIVGTTPKCIIRERNLKDSSSVSRCMVGGRVVVGHKSTAPTDGRKEPNEPFPEYLLIEMERTPNEIFTILFVHISQQHFYQVEW